MGEKNSGFPDPTVWLPLSSRLTVNPTDRSYAFIGYVPGVVYTWQEIPALMINLPPYVHLKCVIVLR